MGIQEDGALGEDIYEMSARASSGELGLRNRHKLDKMCRISSAACALFSEHGYEGATLREIARRADVALGTLSLYAEDKRDLIVMLFNRLIPPLMEEAAKTADPRARFADNMVAYFTPFYFAYAENVTLYRIILGQIFNRPTSIHARENGRIRVQIIGALTAIIKLARATGEIDSSGDLDLQARSFFYIYFATVRLWLANEDPTPEQGVADLRAMFECHVSGFRRPARRPARPLQVAPSIVS